MQPRIQTPDLIDLYKIAVDEYRFEVNLNWDRMKYYLVLNSAVLSVAVGLLELQEKLNVFVGLIFLAGVATSYIGVQAIKKGHQYYEHTVFKKTLLEDLLGLNEKLENYPSNLATLSIGTTKGMAETRKILFETEHWLKSREPRRGSIAFYIIFVLWLFSAVNMAGTGYIAYSFFYTTEEQTQQREQVSEIPARLTASLVLLKS